MAELKIYLYPKRVRPMKSFKDSKIHTVPSQAMTLKEILTRFVRREKLPVMREGIYETRMGDLEKLSREDITVQMERAEELKTNISKAQKRMKDAEQKRIDAEIKRKAEEQAALAMAEKAKPDKAGGS